MNYKKDNIYALRYDVLFLLRRYVICITCVSVGFTNIPAFFILQINLQLWSTGFSLSYIAWHQPHNSILNKFDRAEYLTLV